MSTFSAFALACGEVVALNRRMAQQIFGWSAFLFSFGGLTAGTVALLRINKWFRTVGIFQWHSHRGGMRRKLRDGSFEYREASAAERLDQVERGAI